MRFIPYSQKKQARLLRIALFQRLRRGSAAARRDGQVQRMARYSGTQVNPREGGQPSTTLTTVCYSTNIYIFTLTRRHTHTHEMWTQGTRTKTNQLTKQIIRAENTQNTYMIKHGKETRNVGQKRRKKHKKKHKYTTRNTYDNIILKYEKIHK